MMKRRWNKKERLEPWNCLAFSINKRALSQVIFSDGFVKNLLKTYLIIHKIAESVIKIYFDSIILYILLIIVFKDG